VNTPVTLTAEEFRELHNGIWRLDCMVHKLTQGNVHEGQDLAEILQTLRDALQGAYAQDEQDHETKYRHYAYISQRLGLSSVWSIYDVEDMSQPHPWPQAQEVVYRDHWGRGPTWAPITGTTWAALYVAADQAIQKSGDQHHIYIESFRLDQQGSVIQLVLTTGS